MADTPDLSRIVNLIMENPKLISEISALAKGDSESAGEPENVVEASATEAPTISVPRKVSIAPDGRRDKLLHAMKPYLSEKRGRTIDTLMSIAGVFHTMKG